MDEPNRTGDAAAPGSIASEATVQVRSIISAAEGVADALKREADRRAEMRVLEAEGEAARLIATARREADGLVAERRKRIGELSDLIMERAEMTLTGLDEAGAAKRQLQEVLVTLEQTAARLVREAEAAGIQAEARVRAASTLPDAPAAGPDAPTPEAEAGTPEAGAPAPAQGESPPSAERATEVPASESGSSDSPAEAAPTAASRRANAGPNGDLDRFGGARQIAFQMAVAGSTRAEVAAHLQRVFEIDDPHPILNEVFGDAEVRR